MDFAYSDITVRNGCPEFASYCRAVDIGFSLSQLLVVLFQLCGVTSVPELVFQHLCPMRYSFVHEDFCVLLGRGAEKPTLVQR